MMEQKLRWQGRFDAAHRLLEYAGKCHNLHGHGYEIEVEITMFRDSGSSPMFIIDYGDLKKIVDRYDHAAIVYEADLEFLKVVQSMHSKHVVVPRESTTENLSAVIAGEILDKLVNLHGRLGQSVIVRLHETPKGCCEAVLKAE